MIPLIMMVGADKGGTGKTTVCRCLLDYLEAQGTPRRVFDSEWPGGSLNRFYQSAHVLDISSVSDQMRIFDAVDTQAVTIVDVRAGLLSPLLRALDAVKLLEDVRKGAIKLAVLHVLGPSLTKPARNHRDRHANRRRCLTLSREKSYRRRCPILRLVG